MENFVLYHEIYKRDGMTMYKGRKKGTITYVAISCIDKGERIKVTNHVRLVYELEHRHIVKFYEWYETSNHLWLVTELCVGGTLAQILQQDVSLPESAVRIFACHLVRGLHHMHGNELIYANWHPSKIILAGDGSLKFFDFSDSRKINEDQQDLIQRFFSTLNLDQSEIDELFACRPVCEYTAPEILQGSAPGTASDIWGLACIMYEMFAGSPPFTGDDPQQLTHNILHTPLIVPRAHSASSHLNDLLQRLFLKEADSRISLADLCSHPFWAGALDDIVAPCPAFISPTPRTAHGPLSVADDTTTSTIDDVSFTLHLGSRPTDTRDHAQTQPYELDQQAPDRSPPQISVPLDQQHLLLIATAASTKDNTNKTQTDDYVKMVKDGRLKYDSKLLAVPPYSLTKWKTLRKSEKDKHLKQLEALFKNAEKGPPSQRRLHLINYLAQMCMAAEVSNHVMESGLAMDMCRQLKSNSNQELLARVCQTLAIVYHHSTYPSNNNAQDVISIYGEIVTILADVLRDQFRCSRVKLPCVSALGEALVKLAQVSNEPLEASVSLAINLLNRCLQRTEEVTVSLAAARVIESVAQYGESWLTRQLASGETMLQLYTGYKHATIDLLKTSAINGLCRLTRIDAALFGGLIDKIGPQSLLDNLHLGLLSVQEAIMEMFLLSVLVQSSSTTVVNSSRRLTQDGGVFLIASMRLLETTSSIVRAKSLCLVLLLCQSDLGLLRVATDHRLVLYLERELKRVMPLVAGQVVDHSHIIDQCVGLFTTYLATNAVPTILQQCCSALAAVHGRKHPSTVHIKSLRRVLPLLDSVAAIVSSSSLRTPVLSSSSSSASSSASPSFTQSLGNLLLHAQLIDNGQTNIGSDTAPQFLSQLMSLVEAACHSANDPGSIISTILIPLAQLTSTASNTDLRIIGLKLCGDIIHMVDTIDSDCSSMEPLKIAVETCLIPQTRQFFKDPDPSAVYLLRLLRHYLTLSTAETCVHTCRTHNVPHLLVQLFIDHQTRVMAATIYESLLLVSAISVVSADLLRDLVIDVDLMPVLCEIVLEIGDHYHKDEKCQQSVKTTETFQIAMDSLYALSRLVSDVVRLALQSKKKGDNEELTAKLTVEAEELLGAGKPLTETVDLLIFTIGDEGAQTDIGDTATRLLNQVVSLYGGQQIQHGVREANLRSLCVAINNASMKQRRTLLRILKRLLVSGHSSIEGCVCVRQMVAKMGPVCASEADSASHVLLDDIVRFMDKQ